MLLELAIKNFAIIDDLRIRFDSGLTILSGETGAGKSIIINAVNLLLGTRATAKMIRTGEKSAEIEASFKIQKKRLAAKKLDEHGYHLDTDDDLLIKRIISANNRHKIYINGSLATMQVLTRITPHLASISGQHAHQLLLKEDAHLLILDQFAGLLDLRQDVQQIFQDILPLLKERDRLTNLQQKRKDQMELLAFQKNEIEATAISPGEAEALEKEKKRLKNATELFSLVHGCLEGLYDGQGSVAEQLAQVRKNIDAACQLDDELTTRQTAVIDVEARIEDMVGDLRTYLDTVHLDENRLEAVEERLDLLIKLKKKYGQTLDDVLAYLNTIETELAGLENLNDEIDTVNAALDAAYADLTEKAVALSKKRRQAAKKFARAIEAELAQLKMDGTQFDIAFSTTPADDRTEPLLAIDGQQVNETGLDKIAFQIAPNPGEAMKPLAGIASGGELSRVVLALKEIGRAHV
jgi:DNA repair protein RecN (Recombination protein N)